MYVLVRLVTRVLGTSETGLRATSLFFGCLLLVAIYELCLELGLSVWRALVVVATFALTPFFIRHATEARHYAMLTTFVTLATTRALRLARGSQNTSDSVGFALSAVAAAATHYFGLAYAAALLGVVGGSVGWSWKQTSRRRRLITVGSLVACLAPLVYFALRAARVGNSFGVGASSNSDGLGAPAFNAHLLQDIPRDFSLLATSDVWSLGIEPALAVLGLVLLSLRLRGLARALPVGLGLAPCVAALFLSAHHSVAARYLAPSAILYHLGACHALLTVVDRARLALASAGRGALAPLGGGLVLVGLLGVRVAEYPVGFGAGSDDYRGLQRYFLDNLAQDTALVAYPGRFGRLLFGKHYSVGSRPLSLEVFRRVPGIRRYLVIEIHSDEPERQAEIESLVAAKMGLAPDAWSSLPLLPLQHSAYQTAVVARLVDLPPRHKKHKKRRHRKRPSPDGV
jgi:hypothetical protein